MNFLTFVSQLYGKGEETTRRLRSAGYTTAEKLSRITPEKLSTITGLSISSAKGIIITAAEMRQQGTKQRKRRLVEIEGIGDGRAKKLQKAGLRTVKAVALAQEDRIAKLLKIPESTARKIVKSAQEVEGSLSSRGMTTEETEVLATQVVPGERRTEEKPKFSSESTESFWRFG
jgi:predicted RecB family nuclease